MKRVLPLNYKLSEIAVYLTQKLSIYFLIATSYSKMFSPSTSDLAQIYQHWDNKFKMLTCNIRRIGLLLLQH